MAVRTSTIEGRIAPAAPAAAARAPAAYMNPYLAGVGLGLVLLSAFVVMGRGLGASGAFTATVTWLLNAVAPDYVASREFLAARLNDGHPLKEWLVFEVLGVVAGAFVSALLAGRLARGIEKGPHVTAVRRLAFAFTGGAIAAVGAALARGCTSGQALTGGALLNLGSWVFMLAVFGGGYGIAWFVRRQWQ